MIEALTINKEFETDKTGSRLGPGDRCRGYPVASLPVGTTIDTNSNLIVVIGDNGSGKTTLTEKLGLQLSERGRSHVSDKRCRKTMVIRPARKA